MRLTSLLPLVLAACSPAPAPPSSQSAAEPAAPTAPPSAANADARALQQAPTAGQWRFVRGEDVFDATFSTPSGNNVLAITCYAGRGITLTLSHAPSTTSLRVITATRTLELPARNGAVRIDRTAPEHDALITMLGTPGDRFAVDAGGAITVLPWDAAIGTTLSACR